MFPVHYSVFNQNVCENSNNFVIKSLIDSYSLCGDYRAIFERHGCKDFWSVGKIRLTIYNSVKDCKYSCYFMFNVNFMMEVKTSANNRV